MGLNYRHDVRVAMSKTISLRVRQEFEVPAVYRDGAMDEIEEVILALKAAGWAVPAYKILDDGVVYFDNGRSQTNDTGVHFQEPRGQVD